GGTGPWQGVGANRPPAALPGHMPATAPKAMPPVTTLPVATKGGTDKDRAEHARKTALPPSPSPVVRVAHRPLGTCSDAASRPLAERIVLWKRRIARAQQAGEIVAQYDMARVACELPDWRDQAALLDLLQQRIATEDAAQALLSTLASEPDAQRYVARAILRRTVDTRLAAAVARVLFGGKVDWAKVDRELLDLDKPDAREAHLRDMMLVSPG